jgi:hypothetical protein
MTLGRFITGKHQSLIDFWNQANGVQDIQIASDRQPEIDPGPI